MISVLHMDVSMRSGHLYRREFPSWHVLLLSHAVSGNKLLTASRCMIVSLCPFLLIGRIYFMRFEDVVT